MLRPLCLALTAMTLLLPSGAAACVVIETSLGVETKWETLPIYWFLNDAGTPDIPALTELESVTASFTTWESIAASYVRFEYRGTTRSDYDDVRCANPGSDGLCTDALNIVTWTEQGWQESPAAIALTYNLFFQESGKIFESDITLNGEDYVWATDANPDAMDLQNILTHEIGHLLGLGHTDVAEATMYALADPGETQKRDLDPDDEECIRHLYPARRNPADEAGGCIKPIVVQPTATPPPASAVLLLVTFALVRRRR